MNLSTVKWFAQEHMSGETHSHLELLKSNPWDFFFLLLLRSRDVGVLHYEKFYFLNTVKNDQNYNKAWMWPSSLFLKMTRDSWRFWEFWVCVLLTCNTGLPIHLRVYLGFHKDATQGCILGFQNNCWHWDSSYLDECVLLWWSITLYITFMLPHKSEI